MEQVKTTKGGGKWVKLLYAVVLLGGAALILYEIQTNPTDAYGGLGVFFIFMCAWAIGGITGAICLLLRLLKVLKRPDYFMYILCGSLDLIVAIYGSYELAHSSFRNTLSGEWYLLAATGCIGISILLDVILGSHHKP